MKREGANHWHIRTGHVNPLNGSHQGGERTLTEKSTKGALAEANPGIIERLCQNKWKEAERQEKDKLRGVDRDAT